MCVFREVYDYQANLINIIKNRYEGSKKHALHFWVYALDMLELVAII